MQLFVLAEVVILKFRVECLKFIVSWKVESCKYVVNGEACFPNA